MKSNVEAPVPVRSPLSDRIHGLIQEVRSHSRYWPLLGNLVSKQLKLKYRGSALGFLWSLLNPLAMVLVYTVVFHFIMRLNIPNYAFFLVAGVIHWEFFASSVQGSTSAILSNHELIRKIRFPRTILPASLVIFELVQLLLALVAFMLIYLVVGGQLWRGQLLYPVVLLLQVFFVFGVSAMISAATVFLRDLEHLVNIVLRLLFWLTPIVYPLDQIPKGALHYFQINPMLSYVVLYRDLLYYRTWPDLFHWMLAIGYGLGFLVAGVWIFIRLSPRFAEEV